MRGSSERRRKLRRCHTKATALLPPSRGIPRRCCPPPLRLRDSPMTRQWQRFKDRRPRRPRRSISSCQTGAPWTPFLLAWFPFFISLHLPRVVSPLVPLGVGDVVCRHRDGTTANVNYVTIASRQVRDDWEFSTFQDSREKRERETEKEYSL